MPASLQLLGHDLLMLPIVYKEQPDQCMNACMSVLLYPVHSQKYSDSFWAIPFSADLISHEFHKPACLASFVQLELHCTMKI